MPFLSRHLKSGLVAIAMVLLPTAPSRAESIVVTLWGSGMWGVPYAVAMEKGYFKEAGVDLKEIAGGAGGAVVRNLMASPIPFGEVGTPSAIAAFKQGLPIIIIGAGGVTFDAWLAPQDSKIASIQDLVGKKVAYNSPKSMSEVLLLMLLKTNGVDPAKVTRVSAGSYGAGLTLLQNGGVDLAPVVEPLRTQVKGKYKEIFTSIANLPLMTGASTVVDRNFAAKNPEKVKALLLGRRRGVDFIYSNPEEAGKIVAKAYQISEDVAVPSVVAAAQARQWSVGEIDMQKYSNLADGLRLTEELTGDLDWKSLIDTSYLPSDLRAKSSAEIRK